MGGHLSEGWFSACEMIHIFAHKGESCNNCVENGRYHFKNLVTWAHKCPGFVRPLFVVSHLTCYFVVTPIFFLFTFPVVLSFERQVAIYD
jgi:hypothetical protein